MLEDGSKGCELLCKSELHPSIVLASERCKGVPTGAFNVKHELKEGDRGGWVRVPFEAEKVAMQHFEAGVVVRCALIAALDWREPLIDLHDLAISKLQWVNWGSPLQQVYCLLCSGTFKQRACFNLSWSFLGQS